MIARTGGSSFGSSVAAKAVILSPLAKRRRALLESNPPRNSQRKLIETMNLEGRDPRPSGEAQNNIPSDR